MAGADTLIRLTSSKMLVSYDGTLELDVTKTAGGAVDVAVGGTTIGEFAARPTIDVRLSGSNNVTFITLHAPLTGSLYVRTAGTHFVHLKGDAFTIGGDLRVGGDSGDTQVDDADGAGSPIAINGDLDLALKAGHDTFSSVNDVIVEGSATFLGVNTITVGPTPSLHVLGDLRIKSDQGSGTTGSFTSLPNSFIGRKLVYDGDDGDDQVGFDAATVKGIAKFTLRGGDNGVLLRGADVAGAVTQSGDDGADGLLTDATTTLHDSVSLTLHNGVNVVDLRGTVSGTSLRYTGGNAHDNVTLLANAPGATAVVKTLGGDDTLQIEPGFTTLNRLVADLGGGTDTFATNGYVIPSTWRIDGVP
jgi:hypothetical protein